MAIDPIADMLAIFQKAMVSQVPTIIAGCGVGPDCADGDAAGTAGGAVAGGETAGGGCAAPGPGA